VIQVTPEHPLYVEGRGWTPAGEVIAGDMLSTVSLPIAATATRTGVRTAAAEGADSAWNADASATATLAAGELLEVESNESTGESATVYNFRVADHHTYFVGTPAWGFGVWVHNTYRKTTALSRTVYQDDALFELGVPSRVDARYVHPSIRQRIARGESNLDLMRSGNAPIGIDGRPVNLHHSIGQEPGPMVEILGSTHSGHHRPLHGLIERGRSFRNDPVKLAQYNDFRKQYWINRANGVDSMFLDNGAGI
jgi:A nuclease of the HNH/ENDO VII superfamily with conserved LHH/Pretoxin HINT domain